MPELPEVETVRRGLNKLIIGLRIKKIDSDNPKSFPNSGVDVSNFALGSSVLGVRRRAKVLIIDLSSNYSFVIHLKMTGQLVFINTDQVDSKQEIVNSSNILNTDYRLPDTPNGIRFGAGHPNDSLVGRLPDKSTRVITEFSDGSNLYFNDQRKFGWMRLMPTVEVENIDFMKKVGPEPLESDFTSVEFASRFKSRSRSKIKAALLDQSVIAGVGNIYADESLWEAQIHPATLVGDVNSSRMDKLYDAVRSVMNLSIEKGGSTDRNYVDAEGNKGSYLSFARVFRREGQACHRCGAEIVKLRVAGRGTHICPNCQKL